MSQENLSNELFSDLIGQTSAVSLLTAALRKHRIAPAYLFSGPHGVGRKIAALRFLEGVITGGEAIISQRRRLTNYNHPDLLWVEPTYLHQGKLIGQSLAQNQSISNRIPPQIRLEQIRDVKRFLSKQPVEANLGMVVIEDVETMAEGAANALLKTLEEPGNGLLILISARPERLLQTIHSRCQTIPFLRLNSSSLQEVIHQFEIKNKEELSLPDNPERNELLNLANGSPGALIKHLETWNTIPSDLLSRMKELPGEPIEALSLARDLTQNLDVEQQIWLINWLQEHHWRKEHDSELLKRLEKLRSHLHSFVQPRLAWEVALLEMKGNR